MSEGLQPSTSDPSSLASRRVLWVTNMAPPYRLPLWNALATQCQLRVGLLENDARLGRSRNSNRGADWRNRVITGGRLVEYRTVRVDRGEDSHYGLLTADAFTDLWRSDVVLLGGWDSPAYWQLLAQARLTGTPTVGFHESTLASQSRREGPIAEARQRFFRQLDRVVVPGPAARDAILAMGVEPHRVLVGFNAVDTSVFRAAPRAEPHEGHRYLCVSQLIDRKNLDGTLRAFAEIAGEQDRLTIVGRGERASQLADLAASLQVSDRVTFVEYVPNAELPAVMAEHDTLVLASHVEVWGLVVNEALATGMQVVVGENCGVAPSVAGMPGVLLSAADASDLAEVMRRARDDFQGRVADPPILEHTPQRFAEVFARAFTEAIDEHDGGRRAE